MTGASAGVVRVALLGGGRIAQLVHLPVLRRLPGVRLTAIAEPDSQRREEAGRLAPGAALLAGYREALDRDDVDAVVVSLPTHLHAEAACAAFQRGKAVYVEKPIASDLAAGAEVLARWRAAGTAGMVGFNYRFHPLYREAKRLVAEGRVGPLVAAQTAFTTAARALPPWKQTRASGGGVLLDQASHHIDLVRFVLGQEVAEVQCLVRSQQSEQDGATLQMRLEDGTLVQSVHSLAAVDEDRFTVFGQSGMIVVDRLHGLSVETAAARPQSHLQSVWARTRPLLAGTGLLRKLRHPGHEPSFALAMGHFTDCVRQGCQPSPDLEDGFRSLAVAVAAEESAATGRACAPRAQAHARDAGA